MSLPNDNGLASTRNSSPVLSRHQAMVRSFSRASDSVAVYLKGIPVRSQLTYLAVLIFTGAGLASLPFLYTTVSIRAPGIIRPAAAVTQVSSLVSGRIATVFMLENEMVKKGDLLLTLESDGMLERESYLKSRSSELQLLCEDIALLLNDTSGAPRLETSIYQQSWQSYRQQLDEYLARYQKADTDFTRNRELHNGQVIADVEFENYQFARDQAASELKYLRESQLVKWQEDHRRFRLELNEINTSLEELRKKKSSLRVTAAVSGTLHDVSAVYAGSFVFANQPLGSISPDTALIVEVYVPPSDIGLLQPGMTAAFTIDAFNYNQWGLASGRITAISPDVRMMRENPIFDIRCTLDNDYLSLNNGYRGHLKKGMTLQARFPVASRSLWQLLYDQMDDWLNPVRGGVNVPEL